MTLFVAAGLSVRVELITVVVGARSGMRKLIDDPLSGERYLLRIREEAARIRRRARLRDLAELVRERYRCHFVRPHEKCSQ